MKYHKSIPIVFLSLSMLFIGYYVLLSINYGINGITFSWTWLCMGILLFGIAVFEIIKKRHLLSYFPKVLRILCIIFMVTSLGIFTIKEGAIVKCGQHVSKTQYDTVIVLGAQLKGEQISRLLRYRLEAALKFHEQYPNATIIVSGGQGPLESRSEASAMKAWLIQHGIEESQILMEDQSHNTNENFAFSKKLLKKDTPVSVISNDFHMYRANVLCKQNGMQCALYPAKSDFDLSFNFYFREFFGVIKDQYLTKLQ